jgi:hypothetical protein
MHSLNGRGWKLRVLLGGNGAKAVEVMISESVVRELVPRLIEKGADGIIEYPLNKVVNRSDAL